MTGHYAIIYPNDVLLQDDRTHQLLIFDSSEAAELAVNELSTEDKSIVQIIPVWIVKHEP